MHIFLDDLEESPNNKNQQNNNNYLGEGIEINKQDANSLALKTKKKYSQDDSENLGKLKEKIPGYDLNKDYSYHFTDVEVLTEKELAQEYSSSIDKKPKGEKNIKSLLKDQEIVTTNQDYADILSDVEIISKNEFGNDYFDDVLPVKENLTEHESEKEQYSFQHSPDGENVTDILFNQEYSDLLIDANTEPGNEFIQVYLNDQMANENVITTMETVHIFQKNILTDKQHSSDKEVSHDYSDQIPVDLLIKSEIHKENNHEQNGDFDSLPSVRGIVTENYLYYDYDSDITTETRPTNFDVNNPFSNNELRSDMFPLEEKSKRHILDV